MATYQSDEQVRYGQAQGADERYHKDYAGGWADAISRQGQLGREGVAYAEDDATSAGMAQQRGALGQAARGGMAAGMGGGRGGSALARRAGMGAGASMAREGVNQSSLLRAQEMQRAQRAYDASLNQQVQGHQGYTGLQQGLEQAQADQAQREWLENKRERERMYDQVSAAYGAVAGTIGSAAKGGGGMSDARAKDRVSRASYRRGVSDGMDATIQTVRVDNHTSGGPADEEPTAIGKEPWFYDTGKNSDLNYGQFDGVNYGGAGSPPTRAEVDEWRRHSDAKMASMGFSMGPGEAAARRGMNPREWTAGLRGEDLSMSDSRAKTRAHPAYSDERLKDEAKRGADQRATELKAGQAADQADAEAKRGSELLDAQRAYQSAQQQSAAKVASPDRSNPNYGMKSAIEASRSLGNRFAQGMKESEAAKSGGAAAKAPVAGQDGAAKASGMGGMGGGGGGASDSAGRLLAANERTAKLGAGPQTPATMYTDNPSTKAYTDSQEGSELLDRVHRGMPVDRNQAEVHDVKGQGLGIRVGSGDDAITVMPEGNYESARAKMQERYGADYTGSPGTAKAMPLQDYSLGGGSGGSGNYEGALPPARATSSYLKGVDGGPGYDFAAEYGQSPPQYMYPADDYALSDADSKDRIEELKGQVAVLKQKVAASKPPERPADMPKPVRLARRPVGSLAEAAARGRYEYLEPTTEPKASPGARADAAAQYGGGGWGGMEADAEAGYMAPEQEERYGEAYAGPGSPDYVYPGLSDERRKRRSREGTMVDREAAQTMRQLEPYHWRYKPEVQQKLGLTGREHVSPSAQDIERTPLGRNVVYDTPVGKKVDTTGAMLQSFTMLSSLQHQLDDMKRGRRV